MIMFLIMLFDEKSFICFNINWKNDFSSLFIGDVNSLEKRCQQSPRTVNWPTAGIERK